MVSITFLIFVIVTHIQLCPCETDFSKHKRIIKYPRALGPKRVNIRRRAGGVDTQDSDGDELTSAIQKEDGNAKIGDIERTIWGNKLIVATLCNTTYFIEKGEVMLIHSNMRPNSYSCIQNFTTMSQNESQMLLNFECLTNHFRLNCDYESLTIKTETTYIKICSDDKIRKISGANISVNYQRRLFGHNGGYICTIGMQVPERSNANKNFTKLPQNYIGCNDCGFGVGTNCPSSGKISRMSSGPTTRIVGGQNSTRGDYPWMAYLEITDNSGDTPQTFKCGGILITPYMVLTAAHCLEGNNGDIDIKVHFGRNDLRISESTSVTVSTKRFFRHEDYDAEDVFNDIAVVHLPTAVKINDFIKPICLPSDTLGNLDGLTATAAGWGRLAHSDPKGSDVLQSVRLEIVAHDDCLFIWHLLGIQIYNTQLCAFAAKKDTCTGDSGGPLAVKLDDHWILVGITSYGIDCAHPFTPGVYTRVSKFIPWIQNQTEEHDKCL